MTDTHKANRGRSGRYSGAQRALLRTLLEREKCSAGMLAELTGIPYDSVGVLRRTLKIKAPSRGGPPKGRTAAILNARKLARLKVKYAQQLAILFGKIFNST